MSRSADTGMIVAEILGAFEPLFNSNHDTFAAHDLYDKHVDHERLDRSIKSTWRFKSV